MKALEFIKQERAHHLAVHNDKSIIQKYDEAIKELEAYITNYQGIERRLNNAVIILSVLGHQSKSLATILEKYNKETIELKKGNKDLKER